MPTYDYECQSCDAAFELFQQITEEHQKVCPECGEERLRRLIGAGGAVIFKGSGFYQTDYRSKEYKSKADADTKPSEKNSSDKPTSDKKPSAETSTDTKPKVKKDILSSKKDS